MKRAGIITLYGEFNYGNRLQNYAVCKCLEKAGYKAETIVIKKKTGLKNVLKSFARVTAGRVLKAAKSYKRPSLVREASFKSFTKKHIPTKYVSENASIADKYDIFCTGSDQVWNPCFGGYEKDFDKMLLTFAPDSKKRCFSPSFGISALPQEWRERFKGALDGFERINVREEDGAKIVKELTGKEATVTIDPTLTLSAEEWLEVSCEVDGVKDGYALDYFLGETPTADGVYNSTQEGVEVIKLLDKANKKIYVSGPSEFIYLISKAGIVRTDSFHACVFSIIFGKPFVVYARNDENKDMLSRIETLLALFGKNIDDCLGKITKIDQEIRDKVLNEKTEELMSFYR